MSERERNEEARYTPGPWRLWDGWGPHRDGLMRVVRIGSNESTVLDALAPGTHRPVDLRGTRADLELIAHAPLLLETLRTLVMVTAGFFDEFFDTPNEWTRARDAIAKATNSDRGGMTE